MQTIPLYRYTRPDGGVTVSTMKPEAEYVELFRLVADDGMVLANGETATACTDTDNPDVWYETVETDMTETEEKAKAYDILMGVSE